MIAGVDGDLKIKSEQTTIEEIIQLVLVVDLKTMSYQLKSTLKDEVREMGTSLLMKENSVREISIATKFRLLLFCPGNRILLESAPITFRLAWFGAEKDPLTLRWSAVGIRVGDVD